MKKNKKLLVSFLALNAILSSYTSGSQSQTPKYDRMYNSVVRNIEKGNSNEKTYQTIERILKQKNKELKDLYLQGDYIVKPEYLEWQVFFTGFYDEYSEGRDNTKENAQYHSKVTGYYDADGNYIVTSGSINGIFGKPHQQLQQPKEIDLGIGIQVREPNRQPISLGVTKPSMPLITPVTPTTPSIAGITPILPPLASFTAPQITSPTAPTPFTVTAPTISTVVVSSFNPVTPNIITPSTFTPPTLSFIGLGFGQTNTYEINGSQGITFLNYSNITANGSVTINTGGGTSYSGSISYGPQAGAGTLVNNTNTYRMNAFYSMVQNHNSQVTGNFTVNNNDNTNNTVRFISLNPYEVNGSAKTTSFSGTLTLNGISSSATTSALAGVEHQLLSCNGGGPFTCARTNTSSSIFENNGDIILNSGFYIMGILIDSEGTQFLSESQTRNKGKIIINSQQSIGIDFGQYQGGNVNENPYVVVYPGYVEVNGTNNYGVRVANVFTGDLNYYAASRIDGSSQGNGGIVVKGTKNVGLSLSKQIGANLIGNISNLNIILNGTEGIGILRRNDYAQTGNMVFTGTHIQNLDFDANASKSVLLRSDSGNITLDRNITISKGLGNNVVLQANGSGTSVINNTGRTMTLGTGATTSIGMLSSGSGSSENKGTIVVNEEKSQGIAILGGSSGKNSGIITLNGKEALGINNAGTFTMSSGTITSGAENTIGVYAEGATSATTISGGNIISQNGGIAFYSGDDATITLSGGIINANVGGLAFYNHVNGSGTVTGKYNITASSTVNVAAGGMLLYGNVSAIGDIEDLVDDIKAAFTGAVTSVTANMAVGSNIMYIGSPGGTANISAFAGIPDMTDGTFFTFSGSGYNQYVMNGFDLTLNNDIDSHLDNGAYGKIQFINTDVTVASGINVVGSKPGEVAIAQKNKVGSSTPTNRNIINNGNIILSGNQSTGLAGDYIIMKNTATGTIKLGTNSVGMYIANGSNSLNQGLIELGAGSVGMYGKNDFGSTAAAYGDRKINIENQKDIKTLSGGVTGDAFGIYANNALTSADSSVNLTSTSNIDLKGTGIIIGAYLKKTYLTSAGIIKVESALGGASVGIYGDESTATSITGSIDVAGGAGTGIYLKNSTMSNSATINIDNVSSGIGMYVEATTGNTAFGANTSTISLGDNVTGMYTLGVSAANTGTITNTGIIQSLSTSADKAIGMYVGNHGIGNNSGNIYLTAVGTNENQVGVYNSGTFNMTGGNIEVYSKNGAGLYATNGASLSGGTVKTGGGAIGLYADGTTINLSGTYKSIVENGGIFALNDNSGQIDVTGTIVVDIEAGGMAFSSTGPLGGYLTSLITGSGILEINLKDPTSKLAILDTPGTILLSSIGTAYTPGTTIAGTNVKISSSSDPNYTPFSITKGHLIVNQAVNLNNPTDSYNKSDFIHSKVDVNSVMTGTMAGQLGVGQVNYGTGVTPIDRARIILNNNSIIDLSGNNSTGMVADFGDVTNSLGSFVKVTGEESVGIYGANGTVITNNGEINIGNKSVGIYGVNQLPGTPTYGDGTINITNNGSIISMGTTHGGYGIYANDISGLTTKVTLGAGSNIDVSGSDDGIGVYVVSTNPASSLDIDGNITVGKNGVGVYASGVVTGNINGGLMSLVGDNAIGYYLTNNSHFTNYSGSIHVDGQNITLMITDASSSINLSTPFTVTSTPGSTYVVGNMIGGDFYNNTTATLGSNGSLINGIGTVALFGTASNINSTGTNVSGMVLSGQHTGIPGHTVAGSGGQIVNEEGTNKGIIALGDSSAGMYLTGGARGRNEGTITVNNNSVGIYAEGTNSHLVNNNGIITIGQESTGLFLKDGVSVSNTGTAEINSTAQKAVGIYSENSLAGSLTVTNSNKIDLAGDQSIGIYTTGNNSVTNSGAILIGTSVSQAQPGVGIYADNVGSSINNTASGVITAGDNSIGIYNLNGNVTNDGVITVGHGGTAIYSDSGTITLNMGSSITVGQNDGVGVYAVNQSGTVINNSALSVGDGSYGFVFTGSTTPSFTNNQSATIGNNSIFVFADSTLTADNSGILTMTGSDNIGYYLKNGGSFVNNSNIIGNSGVSNIGVYAKGANITNNADIILGDSNLVEHTDSSGVKYKTGYSVGIYGEDSNITNNVGKTIQVGKEGIGIYVKGTGYIAENYGIINGIGDDAKGIFAADYAVVNNYGTINMTGDNVMGIVGQNGAQIYNDIFGIINVTGNDVTGIYLAGDDTKLINHGQINITGTGMGISYTPTVELSNVVDTTGTTQGYTSKQYNLPDMPTLVNTGVINVNVGGNFNYDGIKVIVTIDPSTNTPTTNSSSQVGFGGVIPNKLEVAPDFAVGTAADRYVFENIFKGATGKGEYISQSLTWDATGQGSDLVMTRKAYMDFTDGLWYEDFGRELNEKYAVTTGEGRQIFDKINYITNETDFRHIMASLAGNVYANINQRENDIAKTFEETLHLLQDSANNTKENVKISVIAGKGKNKEETDGVTGYDYTTTGVLALREVERTYKHTFGYSLGYVHTGFEFKDGNESEEWVDTIQLGMHNNYKTNGWTLRNDLTGRASIHNVDRNIDWPSPNSRSEMDGSYETYSITSDNILGKEFGLGKKASIMPYGAFRAMYVTRPTFNESGLEAVEVEGNDAWSAKPRAGVELKGAVPLGANTAWQLKGTLDLAYEYELADLNEREKARLISIEDGYHKLSKPQDEKGTFRTKAAIGVEVEDRYGIFLTGEYSTGDDKENDYRAGVTLKAVF